MLGGGPPNVIQKSIVGRHQQTWKLREHHLVAADTSGSDSGIDMDLDTVKPLKPGDPLSSYFPSGTQLKEYRDGLIIQEAGCNQVLRYQRASSIEAQKHDSDTMSYVQDIIITGEVGTERCLTSITHNAHTFVSGTFGLGPVQPCWTGSTL